MSKEQEINAVELMAEKYKNLSAAELKERIDAYSLQEKDSEIDKLIARLEYFYKVKIGQIIEGPTKTEEHLAQFLTVNKDMLAVKNKIRKLAKVNDPVLIQGETGTGKELLAKALHGDREGKFVDINCAGMPEQLFESEIFGHERGAFTGANERKDGLFLEASKGTIFLDEIGELDLKLQAKLLRAVQEMTVRRVGSNRNEKISCRFIAATHHNLKELVVQKRFREDLYFRISTFQIKIEPLRCRIEDIELILNNLMPKEKQFPVEFDWLVKEELLQGNVRSLQQAVKQYLILEEMPK